MGVYFITMQSALTVKHADLKLGQSTLVYAEQHSNIFIAV